MGTFSLSRDTRARAALTNGEIFFPDYSQARESRLLGLKEVESVRTWLVAAGVFELHDGNLDEAIENISLLASLARVRRDERLFIGRHRRIATGEMGLDITWEALQLQGWDDARLSQLQASWKMDSILPDIIFALETERGFDVAFYDKVRGSFAEWQKVRRSTLVKAQCGCESEDLPGDVVRSVYAALWRVAWMDQSEVALLKKYQSPLEALRKVVAGQAWHNVYHPPAGVDGLRYYLLNGGFGWAEMTVRTAMQFETRRQMTLTAIALKRFELRHGRLPADLRELVPGFLTGLPRDYMADQPLRYHLNADGTFTLYSVGENGHDDGGNPTRSRSPEFLNPFVLQLWDGRDAVWPQPATTEDAAHVP